MGNIFTEEVVQSFLASAPELRDYIETTGVELHPTYSPPFERLLRSIIYQQLSGKAASSIFKRFEDLLDELTPDQVLRQSEDGLRAAGLSRQKAGYVQNVARAFQPGGHLAAYRTATDLDDLSIDEIIEKFTTIKGVGEWTVQMYLIFSLGRLDVFAAKDLGVRKGLQVMYGLEEVPTPGQAKKLTSHWSHYPTVGTVLSWQVIDTA